MGNRQNRRSLAHQIASEMVERLELSASTKPGLAQDLYETYSSVVYKRIRSLRPATLGIIAASGRAGTLYRVHCGTWLGKYDSGRTLLRDIAVTAIIAEMADILRDAATSLPWDSEEAAAS